MLFGAADVWSKPGGPTCSLRRTWAAGLPAVGPAGQCSVALGLLAFAWAGRWPPTAPGPLACRLGRQRRLGRACRARLGCPDRLGRVVTTGPFVSKAINKLVSGTNL